MQTALKYWAFISYSSKDQEHGAWLIDALETYRLPSSLVGRQTAAGTVPKRLLPVFRDRDELRSESDLDEALETALRQSRFLIVLCSPNSARPSSWVNKEITKFKAQRGNADVLALIVDGEPNASARPGSEAAECFPEALRYQVDASGRITRQRVEPLAADIRREDSKPRTARRKALLKLVARIVDVDFDDLWRRDRQRQRRKVAISGTAAAIAMAVVAGLLLAGVDASRSELSVRLAEQATAEVSEAPGLALLLSVAAFETAPTAAAYGSLLATVGETAHLVTHINDVGTATAVALSGDGERLAVAACRTASCTGNAVFLYDLNPFKPSRPPIEMGESVITGLAFHPANGKLLATESSETSHRLVVVDPTGAETVAEQIYRDGRAITSVEWSNDGRFYAIAVSDGGRFNEYKLFPEGAGRRCGNTADVPIVAMAFAPDAGYLAVGGERGPILVVDTTTCAARQLHHDRLRDLAFDSSGRYLAAIMPDGTLSQWDLQLREPVRRNLPLIRVPLNGFLHAFAADADRLASKDGTHVLVHDLATRREILQRLNDEDAPDLVEEATLRLALEQLEPTRLRGHRGEPEIMRFSAHGDALVTADDGGNVLIWDVAGKPLVEELDAFVESGANAIAAVGRAEAISADGRILARAAERAVGCSGDYVLECERTTSLTLRNRTTGEVIGTLEASRRGLGAIEWSETLAVEFTAGGDVLTVGFTQDGRPTARYAWHVDPEALIERACRRANRELGRDDVEMRRYVQGWRSLLVAQACGSR